MVRSSFEFRVWVYARTAFDTKERASRLVDHLVTHSRFAPNLFGTHEPLRRLTKDRIADAIELVVNRTTQELRPDRVISMVLFERSRPPMCSYRIYWSRLPHRAFESSSYAIQEEQISHKDDLMKWLGFTFGLIGLHEAWYALFALEVETHAKNFLTWHTQHPQAASAAKGVEGGRGVGLELTESIPGVYWGNYFGPFYIEWFGRERFDTLPCVEKCWLDTGGIFFTTAPTPFDWDTVEARRLQQAVKEYLGAAAFFDIEVVRQSLSELEPIPRRIEPEQLQPPRRVPIFPFKIEAARHGSLEEEVAEARRYFEEQGFIFECFEESVLTFRDSKGGITHITFEPDRKVEYWPKL